MIYALNTYFMSVSRNEEPGTATAAILDFSRLAMLMEMEEENDSPMIKEIAGHFIEDITAVMSRSDAAISTGNFSQIATSAHTIKGSAATFGLPRVETIARELEASAKDTAKHDFIPSVYQSLREAFQAGCAALEAYFADR